MSNRTITFVTKKELIKPYFSEKIELIPPKKGYRLIIHDIKRNDKGLSIEWEYLKDEGAVE